MANYVSSGRLARLEGLSGWRIIQETLEEQRSDGPTMDHSRKARDSALNEMRKRADQHRNRCNDLMVEEMRATDEWVHSLKSAEQEEHVARLEQRNEELQTALEAKKMPHGCMKGDMPVEKQISEPSSAGSAGESRLMWKTVSERPNEIGTATRRIVHLNEERRTSEDDIEMAHQRIVHLEKERCTSEFDGKLEKMLQKANQDKVHLEEERRTLTEQVGQLKEQVNQRALEMSHLELERSDYQNSREIIAQYKKRIEDLTCEKRELQGQFAQLEKRKNDYKTGFHRSQKDLHDTQTDAQAARDDLNRADGEIQQLHKTIGWLRDDADKRFSDTIKLMSQGQGPSIDAIRREHDAAMDKLIKDYEHELGDLRAKFETCITFCKGLKRKRDMSFDRMAETVKGLVEESSTKSPAMKKQFLDHCAMMKRRRDREGL